MENSTHNAKMKGSEMAKKNDTPPPEQEPQKTAIEPVIVQEQPSQKKIYRSKSDKMIAGVCGGFAEYFGIDVVLIRVIWAVLFFVGGTGFIAYLASWFIIPENPNENSVPKAEGKDKKMSGNTAMIIGVILVVVGAFMLFDELRWPLMHFRFLGNLDMGLFLSVALVGAGIYLLINKDSEKNDLFRAFKREGADGEKRLTRSIVDKKIAGVCGGIANYYELDVSLVRVLAVILGFAGGIFVPCLLYLVMVFVMPEEDNSGSESSI